MRSIRQGAGVVAAFIRSNAGLLAAVATGAFLRFHQLGGQIPVGDEWHALDAVRKTDFWGIFSNFGYADYSIHVTLYFELASRTVGLSEWIMHVPFAVGGTLSVLLIPLLFRRHVGREAATFAAWALAISPMLIYFSRFVRPYGLTTLMSALGVWLLHEWWTTRRIGYALGFAACVIMSGYLLLLVLPFLFAPLLVLGIQGLARPKRWRGDVVLPLSAVGLGSLIPLGLLVATPMFCNGGKFFGKTRLSTMTPEAMVGALRLLTGLESGLAALVVAAAVVAGVWVLLKRAPLITWMMLAGCGGQILAILVFSPVGVASSGGWVMARYIVQLIPFGALAAAVAVSRALDLGSRGMPAGIARLTRGTPLALCGGALFIGGPLPAVYSRPCNWTINLLAEKLSGTFDSRRMPPEAVPAFYRQLAALKPGSVTIVEAPWFYRVDGNPLPYYQRVHRQKTLVGFTWGLCGQSMDAQLPRYLMKTRFRNFVYLAEPEDLRAKAVDYVVFHRDLKSEWLSAGAYALNRMATNLPDAQDCIEAFRRMVGSPEYEDDQLVVFNVAKPGRR